MVQVAGLAVVSVFCFMSSSFVALLTDIPVSTLWVINFVIMIFILGLQHYI